LRETAGRAPALSVLAAVFLLAGSPQDTGASPAPARIPAGAVPENADARRALRGTIFAPVREAAAAKGRLIEQPGAAGTVAFRAEVQDGAVFLVFANRTTPGASLASAGTFIIKRSLGDGSFVQAKVFLQSDPGCYLRVAPLDAARSRMSVFLFGQPLQKDIVVPAGFETLLTAPFSRLVDLTSTAVDWPLVLPRSATAGDVRLARIVDEVRRRLPRLGDAEDGAMDSSGRFVFIADGRAQQSATTLAGKPARGGFNCSGFAKWVVDGFYAPLEGTLTDVAEMKQRDPSSRGNRWSEPREESRDPYFGLDWSRNLARALAAARGGALPSAEAADVRDAGLFPYVEDVGYPVDSLQTVLYLLAHRDPGAFYLGSVSSGPGPGAGGLRQHHHVVTLFPYVEAGGVFRAAVMERNAESTTSSLAARYPGSMVHLVRLGSEGDFAPPSVE
jgi:hypothetical protein